MVDDSGGLAKVTCEFSNEMKHRGHSVTMVYSDEKREIFIIQLMKISRAMTFVILRETQSTIPGT